MYTDYIWLRDKWRHSSQHLYHLSFWKKVSELLEIGYHFREKDSIQVISGKTLCAHDFYEGQGRLDGAFCEYTIDDKFDFLNKCFEQGIKNIEMESLCFLGLRLFYKT
jgi:uridine phosphorylase